MEVRISISEVASVEFITRMLETRLDLQLRRMQVAGQIPSNTPGLVQFQFAQRHREAARALAAHLRAVVTEQRLKRLESELLRLEE